jgi:hypothetical protein
MVRGLRHKRRVFTMPDGQYNRLRAEADRRELSISETLRRIVDAALPPQIDALTAARKQSTISRREEPDE